MFNYKVDWNLVEKHNILKEKILPWLKQKSVELTGEEEGVLINIIMNKLNARESASNIEKKMEKALEENAEVGSRLTLGLGHEAVQNFDIRDSQS